MIDKRFHKISGSYRLTEIAELINAKLSPQQIKDFGNVKISEVTSLELATESSITFLSNKKYKESLKTTKAFACIVPEDLDIDNVNQVILLRVKNPYFAYTKAINLFYSGVKTYPSKIMPSAYVAKTASIGKNCYIGHNVVIEDNAVIGDDSIIESGSLIDCGVVIGSRAKIYSGVSISYSIIGDDVVILAGAKIGQDGFGFSTEEGIHHKIYHTGRVIIGNNVEIGANTTIDRGSLSDTIIEDLCRIDNLVQIAHNVKIGKGSIIVAQVGIAGSSTIGKYCALGGQVGVAGHIVVGDKVQAAGKTGIIANIESGNIVGGFPAVPIQQWHKQSIIMRKLINENKK